MVAAARFGGHSGDLPVLSGPPNAWRMSCAQLTFQDTGPQYRVCSIRWFAMVARSFESAILG